MSVLKPDTTTTTESVSDVSSEISSPPQEKTETTSQPVDLERFGETHGYALDEAVLKQQLGLPADTVLKKSPEGIALIPQPTDDPRDPLSWGVWKKRTILIMLAITSFTCDYSAATGASALLSQAAEWHISPNVVNRATAGNTFMLGVGGLVTVWLSAFFGRLPVLFFMTIFASATAVWSAAAGTFDSYMASRILNGFFVVAAAGGGLMWINDVFCFHERPRMINIWSCAIILSPFLGPQIMAAIIGVATWRVGMYLNFGIITFALLTIALIGDETFYPRHKPAAEIADIYAMPRWKRILGLAQVKTKYTDNTFLSAGTRTVMTATRLPVVLICLFYFFDFGWTIGNNTTISVILVPAYQLSYQGLARFYCAPVLGGFLGIPIGHYLFDFIGGIWARYHKGVITPEARLIPLSLILPLKIVGYNLIGLSIERHWNIYVAAFGWGMHNLGTILTTSAVGAYLIDCYPEASGESAAWLNASRTLSGFAVGYFHLEWIHAQGVEQVYGIQTGIMGAAWLLFVIPLTVFGAKVRRVQGPLKFKTN